MSAAPLREQISAGILAGGAGARFGGRDKGWIEWQGRPLVEWTLDALRSQAAEILISANRNLERYAALGPRVLCDPDPQAYEGPLAGMVQLLAAARHDWLMCVPCDAPDLPADLARRFSTVVAAEAADIAVVADESGIHPTFCFIRTALAGDAARRFAEGERAPRRWFARHRLAALTMPCPLNLNTPEGMAAVKWRS
jgi:molybdopterin-guanine dinucleotide biosynthesis protein A